METIMKELKADVTDRISGGIVQLPDDERPPPRPWDYLLLD
jgi:hypothetical protein